MDRVFLYVGLGTSQHFCSISHPFVAASRLLVLMLHMKQVSYRGYAIRATAKKENLSWRSHVVISWYAGKSEIYDDVTISIESEAEQRALELGKHWVNNHLQSMQGYGFKLSSMSPESTDADKSKRV